MIYILLFVSQVFAAPIICDAIINGKPVSYEAVSSCRSGHTRNTAKEALNATRDARTESRRPKKAAIIAQCSSASGLLKDLCDYVRLE